VPFNRYPELVWPFNRRHGWNGTDIKGFRACLIRFDTLGIVRAQ